MIRQCVICGKDFMCSPSDKKVTCSQDCRRERARRVNTAKGRKWSKSAKEKLSQKGETPNLKLGTSAAQKSPISGSFITNQEALIWTIKSPDGEVYTVQNLRLFIKENPHLFDGTVEQATHGFYAMRETLAGTRKSPAYQWKGWQLLNWKIPPTNRRFKPSE